MPCVLREPRLGESTLGSTTRPVQGVARGLVFLFLLERGDSGAAAPYLSLPLVTLAEFALVVVFVAEVVFSPVALVNWKMAGLKSPPLRHVFSYLNRPCPLLAPCGD